MIQRIQSIFLLLASAVSGAEFLRPLSIGTFQNTPETVEASKDGVLNIFDNTALLGVTAAVAGLALVTIFLYKNRGLQMNLIKGFLVISLIGLALLGFMVKTNLDALNTNNTTNAALILNPMGIILPFIGIIFSVLAYRAIKKDEDLVRSSDRLR